MSGTMELLILKTGPHYIRVKEGQFIQTGLDKASVFPMAQKKQVQAHAAALKRQGAQGVVIKKLILTEEDYQP